MTRPYPQLSPFALARGEATAGGGAAGPSVGFPFKGAMVNLAADATAQNYTSLTAISFDAELYDVGGWHDNATNNTRLTVPAGVTKVRITAGVLMQLGTASDWNSLVIHKNGAGFTGGSGQNTEPGVLATKRNGFTTSVLDVVEGDYFELKFQVEADTSITINQGTTFSIQAVVTAAPSVTPRGAFVRLTASEAVTTAGKRVPWDETAYDTDSIWSAGSATRLTVPAGVTHVQLVANVRFDDTAFTRTAEIWKNGATASDLPFEREDRQRGEMNIKSAVLEVVSGDYFELNLGTSTNTNAIDSNTWFAMQIVEPALVARESHRGALVNLAADETAANYATRKAVPFDAEQYDTDVIHDNVTLKTRLTVPAGVTKVRLTGQVVASLAGTNEFANLNVEKNGSTAWIGTAETRSETAQTTVKLSVATTVVVVVPGDYFELFFQVQTDASITIASDRTSFSMEIVE